MIIRPTRVTRLKVALNMAEPTSMKHSISSLKGMFSDSNNIFLLHKSEDINQNKTQTKNKNKRLFPKFHLILIFRLQVLHYYVHALALLDIKNNSNFTRIPLGKCTSGRKATNRCKIFKF